MSYKMLGATEPYKLVGSVCKPTDFATLERFKELQRQLNRVAAAKHYPKISVDGDLGPGTVALYNRVVMAYSTCGSIAGGVSGQLPWVALTVVTGIADKLGAPVASPPKPSRPVQKPDGTVVETNVEEAPMLDRVMGFATSPMGLIAGAGVIGFFVWRARSKGGAAKPVTAFSAAKI